MDEYKLDKNLEKKPSYKSLLGKYFDILNQFEPNEYTLYRGQSITNYEPYCTQELEPLPSLLRSGGGTPEKFLSIMKSPTSREELGLTEHDIHDWARLEEQNFIELEKKLLNYFDELSMKIGYRKLDSKLEKLVTMQHCGIPTRLLDWTTNPLKALFFAVDKVKYHGNYGENGVVYLLKYDREKIYSRNYIKQVLETPGEKLEQINPVYPEPNHPRVLAQESCFTIFPLCTKGTKGKYKSIQDIDGCLLNVARIEIPSAHKSYLRNALRLLGINYFTLSPDLDGIGTEINRFFERFKE